MNNPFDILFEPVPIGPVVAPNRFYQVPHCNGLGHRMPRALAALRGVKAEGGWGVVCTEEVEIHPSSDLAPNIEGRLWDDGDIPALALMTEAVHAHGALAGIELTHAGHHAWNLISRTPALGLSSVGVSGFAPWQTRRLDKEDIRNVRRWHRAAALRAKRAGFDIIICYAAHNLSLAMHFLLRRYNDRRDKYGGSLANRTRFLRELIEDTKEAVGDSCAVAVRLAVDELLGEEGLSAQGEGYEIVALLAELPDLWDVNISDWSNDSATSRFAKEGYQEPYIGFVKSLTSKPVVGVGRYTSPEAMVNAIRNGVMDLVGAARPSIADPFLPEKIRDGCIADIRECIGCNICVTGDTLYTPIRCTQNPTMGEEWRRGWHPERIAPRQTAQEILVVGGGPAGLECARALGQRGYTVTLTEAENEPGGRVIRECRLPGLAEWRRVVDWRLTQISQLPQVSLYPGSPMRAADVLESGFKHVIVATGAQWRRDGKRRTVLRPLPGHNLPHVFTPDDWLRQGFDKLSHQAQPPQLTGQVVIYDDDHYYMGGVLTELLAGQGCQVTLVTAAPLISYWSQYTLEQGRIQRRLTELGVTFFVQHKLQAIEPDFVRLVSVVNGRAQDIAADSVILVTDRQPNDELYHSLKPALAEGKLSSLRVIGDAEAPNIIAQAVFSGHLAAREFEELARTETPFKMEYIDLD
ncbi:MAG: FAD-dependent oxidoreductase [Ardenticatenaceae bacterium]|nr:FAD-dependent oxidoreductase [Ardenticatenaceae bacterium]MCB9445476.1 FAD-dependent oxidoreductase [Ardenticatenaceae bacterium]